MSSSAQRYGLAGWLLLALAGGVLAVLLVLPPLALVARTGFAELVQGLRDPIALAALRLSAFTTSISLTFVVLLGTPLSWLLSRSSSRFARFVETCVQLPIVLPPAVAGLALLLAFGRRGLFSGVFYPRGESVAFTTLAVILAETFVAAPFFVQSATAAFRRIDPRLIDVARSFGATPLRVFVRIGVPLAAPGLVAGAAMCWARSLGEFGATLMFAGSFQGITQTAPLAIYGDFATNFDGALALSAVLVAVSGALLLAVKFLTGSEVLGGAAH
jgi:molybdate transport system permease protein